MVGYVCRYIDCSVLCFVLFCWYSYDIYDYDRIRWLDYRMIVDIKW